MLRKIGILLSLAVLGCIISCARLQYDDEKDFRISLVNNETGVSIIRYAGRKQTVNIPSRIQGKPVVEIGDSAFKDREIISVTIPNGVTTIGDSVFYNNELTNVTIPNGVTIIGKDAFRSNNLTSITIPNGVTKIENWVFGYNNRLFWL